MNNKKALFIACLFTVASGSAWPQANIILPQANIINGIDYNVRIATTNFTTLTGNGSGRITVNATTPALTGPGGTSAPLGNVFLSLASVGSYNFPLNSSEIALKNSSQDLFNSSFPHRNGAVVINYRIPVSGARWEAGKYVTNLTFGYFGLLGIRIDTDKELTLTVPAFMQAPGVQAPPSPVIRINSLDYFRNTAEAAVSTSLGNVISTLPFEVTLRTDDYFKYTPAPGMAPLNRNTLSSAARVSVNPLTAGVPLRSGRIPLNLLDITRVPIGNYTPVPIKYSITGTSLNNNFLYAGDYNIGLTYRAETKDKSIAYNSAAATLLVKVDDMGELLVKDPVINLDFNNAADYVNGKSVEMPAHLTVSKTSPYDVYVKASGINLTNGTSSIPVNIIKIGPASNQTGVQTVTLSTTPVKLISSAVPVIDRSIGIKYSIDPAGSKTLTGKAPGLYTVNLTYSFIAN